VVIDELSHDIAAVLQLDQMSQRAGSQAGHRAFQQHSRQGFATAKHIGSTVSVRRQHKDFRPIHRDVGPAAGTAVRREVPRHIDPLPF
jgi:hypothetical protein